MKRKDFLQKMETVLTRRREGLRQALLGEQDHIPEVESQGVGDSADDARDQDHREISSGLAQAETRELVQIEHALDRLREGTYGACEQCGKRIPLARLQALPYATTCIDCQRRQEEGSAESAAGGGRSRSAAPASRTAGREKSREPISS